MEKSGAVRAGWDWNFGKSLSNPVVELPQIDNLLDTLTRFGYSFPDEQVIGLDRYCQLLWQWNSQLNLTRHTDYERFVARDVCDSVQLGMLLQEGEHVLDVGSGGGVPGMILGILRPDLHLSLAESVGKKAKVLGAMANDLQLGCAVYHCRAEDLLDSASFETLLARAVGPLWKMLKWFENRWESFDRLLAVKGPRWVEERGEARHRGLLRNLNLRRVASYELAGTDSESVILQITPRATK